MQVDLIIETTIVMVTIAMGPDYRFASALQGASTTSASRSSRGATATETVVTAQVLRAG